jgi:hypothetical protein
MEEAFSTQEIQKFPYPSQVIPHDFQKSVHPIYVPGFLPEPPSHVGFIS